MNIRTTTKPAARILVALAAAVGAGLLTSATASADGQMLDDPCLDTTCEVGGWYDTEAQCWSALAIDRRNHGQPGVTVGCTQADNGKWIYYL